MRFTRSLGGRILASFVLLVALFVATGSMLLVNLGSLHSRVTAVNSRDLKPLSHLREAQNDVNQVAIIGFAVAQTDNAAARKSLLDGVPAIVDAAKAAFTAMTDTAPPELKSQAQDVVATYTKFKAADEAYKAGAQTPQAAQLAQTASDLYVSLGAKFDGLAKAFMKDAAAQETAVAGDYRRDRTIALAAMAGTLLVGLLLGLTIRRSVKRRTTAVLATLDAMAQGDLSRESEVGGQDEIAAMATALNSGLAAIRSTLGEVDGSVSRLTASASGLADNADRTGESVYRATGSVDAATSSADLVTATVGAVASSTGELAASIREISQSAQEAARVAGEAVGVVETTNATIGQLGNSSEEIGNVIQVIQSIAAQTSLLALNATIEAARAGEAGRGFAVVAGEVKDLARETAEATDSVINRVQAIQQDTEGAIRAIAEIGGIIQQINQFQGSIAAAVEEQSVTTDSMGDSIREALRITQEIGATLQGAVSAAQESTGAVASTRTLAADVAGMGEQLRQAVARFRI